MIVALIPVKSLATGKSRLRASLPDDAIPSLSLAMLADVVTALQGVPEIDSIAVVTPDENVGEAATRLGARALVRQDPGLDASIAMAAQYLSQDLSQDPSQDPSQDLSREPIDAEPLDLLVIMGDLPGASSEAIGLFIEQARELGENAVAIATSTDGGTTLLLRKPWDAMGTAYGVNSANSHFELAKQAGLPVSLFHHPELAIDLDEPEDLQRFLQLEGTGHQTRALLRKILDSEDPHATPKAEGSLHQPKAEGSLHQPKAEGSLHQPKAEGS